MDLFPNEKQSKIVIKDNLQFLLFLLPISKYFVGTEPDIWNWNFWFEGFTIAKLNEGFAIAKIKEGHVYDLFTAFFG